MAAAGTAAGAQAPPDAVETSVAVEHPEATVDELMRFVQGPDFPTGALILGRAGIVVDDQWIERSSQKSSTAAPERHRRPRIVAVGTRGHFRHRHETWHPLRRRL